MHGNACRELAARGDDTGEAETIALDAERRDGVAARVDGDQELVRGVVDERALRREMIRFRSGKRSASVAARRVGTGLCQPAVARPVVDDDAIARRLVRLDEDEAPLAAVGGRALDGGARNERCE